MHAHEEDPFHELALRAKENGMTSAELLSRLLAQDDQVRMVRGVLQGIKDFDDGKAIPYEEARARFQEIIDN